MKNPIKQMGLMLAAALVMAAGMNCGPSVQLQPTATADNGRQAAAPVTAVAQTTPAGKTSTVDELDVAIRDASDCLNDNIPKGSKIVILNIESSSANIAEYIIDELIANAINDKNFSVVDRRQLEAIQSEQKFQMSGAVADKDALRIGQFFGAQTIVSGAMREMGGRYRMTVRALAVETAVVQSQCNQNVAIAASATLTDLVNSGGGRPTSGATTVTATTSGTTQAATPAATHRATPAAPAIKGTPVPGNKLTEKLDWLKENVESHNTYIIEVSADESIAPYTFEYKGVINVTVVIRGNNVNPTIRLKSHGTMFTIRTNVTFVLENNIILHGHSQNTNAIIEVYGGIFRMNAGSTITGNIRPELISGYHSEGGAVCVFSGGIFEMNGGTISNNAANNGGGVYVGGNGTFTMNDGTISDNTVNGSGGGVYVYEGTFNMRGGIIARNTAGNTGGGVWEKGITFNKSGGTITGSNDANNGNQALSTKKGGGHAIYGYFHNGYYIRYKDATAGPGVNLSRSGSSSSGAWEKYE
jgi:TolB-like protein